MAAVGGDDAFERLVGGEGYVLVDVGFDGGIEIAGPEEVVGVDGWGEAGIEGEQELLGEHFDLWQKRFPLALDDFLEHGVAEEAEIP